MGQTSLVDVDNDNDLDWVFGRAGEMYWYEYISPTDWKLHEIGNGAKTDVGGCSVDLNHDGWIDFIVGDSWYENTGNLKKENFILHKKNMINVHDNVVVDIDGDGISYGGDLALFYPVFSERVHRIFSSGSLGSFNLIFSRCYNAPAHCIPNILKWMDRSDVAGLNIPSPIMIHYGELDTPSETNYSASYNESVETSIQELKDIYRQMQAEDQIALYVTPDKQHEMDIEALLDFLK